jgi:hypothetical protein
LANSIGITVGVEIFNTYVKAETLSITRNTDFRNSCSFQVILDQDYLTTKTPPRVGERTEITVDTVLVFGGIINRVTPIEVGVGDGAGVNDTFCFMVESGGYNHIPARRTITTYWNEETTAGTIVTAIRDEFLIDEGIAEGTISAGATLENAYSGEVKTLQEVLDDMAFISGYKWYIDDNATLHFAEDVTPVDAPHDIDFSKVNSTNPADFKDFRNFTATETFENYRNKQFVVGGLDDDGDEIIVSSELSSEITARIAVEDESTGVYGAVHRDANINSTTYKTAEAGTSATTVNITAHGLKVNDVVINIDRNTQRQVLTVPNGNSFTVSSVASQTSGDEFKWYPDANRIIQQEFKRYGKPSKEISFDTNTLTFDVGQKLLVDMPKFYISSEYFLIETVEIRALQGTSDILTATVKAVKRNENNFSTLRFEKSKDYFAKLAKEAKDPRKQVVISNTEPPANRGQVWVDPTDDTWQFGTPPNYAEFEADGTLVFYGTATTFDDLALPIVPRSTGANRPTLATFDGDIREFTMAVNDVTDVNATELLHRWKEGSTIELHVHWASNGVNADNRAVKWQLSYTWANRLSNGGQTAFPAATVNSAETVIPANTPDKTHLYTSVLTFTPTGGKVGAYLCMALKRIASTGTAPTSNPWILAVGAHYEVDTLGTRTISAK